MSDTTDSSSDATAEQSTETQHVERTDVGVSITVQLKRGSGTRDEDKIKGKVKAETLADAREDMDVLREYLHQLADDTRQIQPEAETE
ncbi:DUF7389 domain-containing protein [Halarchaeum nitratireducens]|uniref:DUF7389 domain-containing protein n=1 Tax=Halarchaeum nitratireducens TaxID=489913 RepID=A0A830GFA5_9EURY|nr:hypothetical protein [Halarchaeum nitratireducens]GGN25486.1 hypothetical protein GCM10009021_29400 [Halarchaeum nitratireducens]